MNSLQRVVGVVWIAGLVFGVGAAGGGCDQPEQGGEYDLDDTAAMAMTWKSGPEDPVATAPDGYLFAVSGTHVERCIGTLCPTMWSDLPIESPKNCGGGFPPDESYIVHQRGVDWNGRGAEAELHGNAYELTAHVTPPLEAGQAPPETLPTPYDQSVIIQCCPAVGALRPVRPGAFIDMKTCPDRCDSPDGKCPITLADGTDTQIFGKCKTTDSLWLISTDRCDLEVVEAGWIDPHAPHDLSDPSGEDKRVFNVYYRAAWTCGDGFCDSGEEETCAGDCATP